MSLISFYFINHLCITEVGFQISMPDEDKLDCWKDLPIKEMFSFSTEYVEASLYTPDVILFRELFLNLQVMIADISILNESKTFHNVLKKTAEEYRNTPNLGFDGVIQKILKPSKEKWDDLGQKLKMASISIDDIEKYCFHELHDDDMIQEFIVINRRKNEKWMRERIVQLKRFKRSLNTVTVARPLLEVKERCNIFGSFKNLELIAHLVCRTIFSDFSIN